LFVLLFLSFLDQSSLISSPVTWTIRRWSALPV
jgi:hypothetical protein